jgi:hypothetical protein
VIDRESALPGVELRPGKGEVLWRSLAATSGDLIVFVDADLVDVGPEVVVGLLGPLLTVDGVALVKGFYRRPLRIGATEEGTGGGRVTELMARPLLARFAPWLSGIIQPLGGEYAGTRDLLESLPFAGGYELVGAERHGGLAATHYRATKAGTTAYARATGIEGTWSIDLWVAAKTGADKLFLLTDVDGLLTSTGADGRLLPEVFQITPDIEALVQAGTGSRKSVGGMASKIAAARLAMASGVEVWIASGTKPGVVTEILEGRGVGTRFQASEGALSARRRWIASLKPRGTVHVDAGAVAA